MIDLFTAIEDCLEKNGNVGALALALTIPDICGKIEFPNAKNQMDWYTRWFNMYIFFPENNLDENGKPLENENGSENNNEKTVTLLEDKVDGEIVYKIRNGIFHSGMVEADVENALKKKYNHKGKLTVRIIYSDEPFAGSIGKEEVYEFGILTDENYKIRIEASNLAKRLLWTGKQYYKEHKKSFSIETTIEKIKPYGNKNE